MKLYAVIVPMKLVHPFRIVGAREPGYPPTHPQGPAFIFLPPLQIVGGHQPARISMHAGWGVKGRMNTLSNSIHW